MSFKINTKDSGEDKNYVAPVREPKKKFVPTEEQASVRKLAIANDVSKVQAVSGSGKTATLVYTSEAEEMQVPSLYMTFNKTMATEAGTKFGSHVACMTTHSLAYRNIGKGYQHKLSRPIGRYVNVALTGLEVARFFRLPDFEVGRDFIGKNFLGLIIKDTVGRFEFSADPSICADNIPYNHIKDLEKKYGKNLPKKQFKKFILKYALRLWEERTDKYSDVCCTHNTYLKLYQLSNPDLSKEYDVLYVDEFQDTNPVTNHIVKSQIGKCKVLVVGDKFQQIYAWNGSINALQSFEAPEATLSKSFRFGKASALLASLILGDAADVKGNEDTPTTIGMDVIDDTKPYTVIFRTNMELIFKAVDLIRKGKSVSVNIDMKDFVKMLQSADALFHNEMEQVKHENIVPFEAWDDLVLESQNDRELGRLVSIVDDGEAQTMIDILHKHKNSSSALITLSTCHKMKGLEADYVQLANDFPSNYNRKGEYVGLSDEERNLLYVASTRAILGMNINSTCQEFYDISGIEIGSEDTPQSKSTRKNTKVHYKKEEEESILRPEYQQVLDDLPEEIDRKHREYCKANNMPDEGYISEYNGKPSYVVIDEDGAECHYDSYTHYLAVNHDEPSLTIGSVGVKTLEQAEFQMYTQQGFIDPRGDGATEALNRTMLEEEQLMDYCAGGMSDEDALENGILTHDGIFGGIAHAEEMGYLDAIPAEALDDKHFGMLLNSLK